MILCNFNINNLFVRYKFGRAYPGDRSGKSVGEDERFGYLPMYQKGSFEIFNQAQRTLAARAITRGGTLEPDVVCIQEVESLIALRAFNEEFLDSAYPYALVIDSRDLRQIDVGILSKHPIIKVRSHVDDKKNDAYVFSRDCLEATISLKRGVELTIFINHFKSKLVQGKTQKQRQEAAQRAQAKRKLQAETVAKIVKEHFPGNDFRTKYFAVLGDFNDTPESPALAPLVKKIGLRDALSEPKAKLPPEDRWTHYYKSEGSVSQLDHVLLSPALAGKLKKVEIERRGIGFKGQSKKGGSTVLPQKVKFNHSDNDANPLSVNFQFERFAEVNGENVASDHCPVFLKFDV